MQPSRSPNQRLGDEHPQVVPNHAHVASVPQLQFNSHGSQSQLTCFRPPGIDAIASSLYSYAGPYGPHADPNTHDLSAENALYHYALTAILCGGASGVAASANGTEPLSAARIVAAPLKSNNVFPTPAWKNRPKKAKAVQSMQCEICKVNCNSSDVFSKHVLGKKHQRNMQIMAGGGAAIAPQKKSEDQSRCVAQGSKQTAAAHIEDLKTKQRKVVEGGAALEAIRVCPLCNVVCNSQVVFSHHLAGQKHAAMVKRRAVA